MLEFLGNPSNQSNLTVVVRLFSGGVQVGADIPTTISPTVPYYYYADWPVVLAAGEYFAMFYDSGNNSLGGDVVYWDGIQEIDVGSHLSDLHKLGGLAPYSSLSVTPTSRNIGSFINQTITQTGNTVTVQRQ